MVSCLIALPISTRHSCHEPESQLLHFGSGRRSFLWPRLSLLTRKQISAPPGKDNPCCSLLGRENTFSFLAEVERRVEYKAVYRKSSFSTHLPFIFRLSAALPWVMVTTGWIFLSCSTDHLFWQQYLFGNKKSILISPIYLTKIWSACW